MLIARGLYFLDLLKNKSRPEEAAEGAAAWVVSEREMKERLKKEREARELKEMSEVSLKNPTLIIFTRSIIGSPPSAASAFAGPTAILFFCCTGLSPSLFYSLRDAIRFGIFVVREKTQGA